MDASTVSRGSIITADKKIKNYTKEDLQFILENNKELSYLNLDWDLIRKLRQANEHPLSKRTIKPEEDLLRVIRNPNNFHFTCKYILNKDILPFQNLILKELWNRPFPMLIGSRGASKTFTLGLYCVLRALICQGCGIVITGAAFRQAKVVFEYIEQLWSQAPVLRDLCNADSDKRQGWHHDSDRYWFGIGESVISALPIGDGCLSPYTLTTYGKCFGRISDYSTVKQVTKINKTIWGNGKFRQTDEAYNNGIKSTKIVKTAMGFGFEGTYNHAMKIVRNGVIDWVRSDQMKVGDRIIVDRSIRWHDGETFIKPSEAHCAGLLVGDGCWTNQYRIGFASADIELSKLLSDFFEGRGWKLRWAGEDDPIHYAVDSKPAREWLIDYFGLIGHYADTKQIPSKIMESNREVMSAFLAGLFDADGHVFVSETKGGTTTSVGFTNTSERLVEEIQYILLHYGIVSNRSSRMRKENENWKRVYELLITGPDAVFYYEKIGFKLKRKQELLEFGIKSKKRNYALEDGIPDIQLIMVDIASRNRKKRGTANKRSDGVSASKIKQKKTISHDTADRFLEVYGHLNESGLKVIRELNDRNIYYDEIISIENGECDTYDIYVPDEHEYCANGLFSHNSKIRGYRANYLVSDEFASQQPEIYENVISGFAFVSSNPVQKVKEAAEIETLKNLNLWTPEQETKLKENYKGNQSILAGTAYYSWNHFYTYYKKYKSYLDSKGDPDKLDEIFQGDPPDGFDWKDYSIIRLPLELVPKGMMDEKQISRSKATTHSTNYQMEFGAVFANDSNGFFKRSLIESCVTKENISKASGLVKFKATISGNPSARYVYGIDPASEEDKFSIVVLEMHEDHNRIVYCWTTDKEDHRMKKNLGVVRENDFYSYINRKIRTLMKIFPCAHISLDSQGGGNSVMEIFRDKSKLEPGEQPLLLITKDHPLSDKKERDCDGEEGLHIVELINFAKYEWTSSANHNMRMDFEHKTLLFPYFDPMQITIAASFDEKDNRLYDTLEDCIVEIEELKDELATIVVTPTTTGKEHFDTPEIKLAGTKKGRMRKDRYSALLMANSSARIMNTYVGKPIYMPVGGFVGQVAKPKEGQRLYNGPAWFTTQMAKGGYGAAVSRGNN